MLLFVSLPDESYSETFAFWIHTEISEMQSYLIDFCNAFFFLLGQKRKKIEEMGIMKIQYAVID